MHLFGFDRGFHETVTQAILHFLTASVYIGQPDRMREALTRPAVREAAIGRRTIVPARPKAPELVPAPAHEEPERLAA